MPKADTALDPVALRDKAQRQTGLSDFGGTIFHEPFEILLQSLRDEAQLNARGVFMLHRTMLRLLTNRLRTEQAEDKARGRLEPPLRERWIVPEAQRARCTWSIKRDGEPL